MARIRMIKPEFFDDPCIGELVPLARLLFIGLWLQADREGRLEDDPRRLKARIFPYDEANVDVLAEDLVRAGLIRRYQPEQNGEKHGYIWICNFTKHQRPHPKEPDSVIPAFNPLAVKRNGTPRKETEGTPESGSLDLVSGTRNLEVVASAPTLAHRPRKREGDYPADFLAFWQAYPRRTAKGQAAKAWAKQQPPIAAVLESLQWQIHQPGWTKDDGQFIPYPASWLNARGWESEPFHLPNGVRPYQPLGKAGRTIAAGVEADRILEERRKARLLP